MADPALAASREADFQARREAPRHSALVRATHWITAICFILLLVTGVEILISHPRLYWGESGNFYTKPIFQIPIPSSRRMVETGYDYVLADQNGWSRSLHFQSAWLLAFTALLYGAYGVLGRHFAKNLLPSRSDLPGTLGAGHLKSVRGSDAGAYNRLQKIAYLAVIFVLFPLVIWTGLAMSPAFVSAAPATVNLLGGHQSARTIHFFVTIALLLFLLVHIAMVWIAGFRNRVCAMITGRVSSQEHT